MTTTADLEAARLEEDIEAAVAWVVDQVDRGTAPDQIALIVPRVEIYGPMLADRLRRLPSGPCGEPVGVHVAGGVPVGTTPAGLRLLGLLRALASGLALDETVRVLPWLRRATQARDDPHTRLSPSRARDIAYGIGLAGATTAPGEHLDWAGRLRRRRDRVQQALAAADSAPLAERRRRALEHQTARRWLKDVEPILPGVEALQALADAVARGATVGGVGNAVAAFVRRWLRMPSEPADLLDTVTTLAASAARHGAPGGEGGRAAVRALIDAAQQARHQGGHPTEARIFVGTPAEAEGRVWVAVRQCGVDVVAAGDPHGTRRPRSRLTPRAELTAVAQHERDRGGVRVPPSWTGDGVLSTERIGALLATVASNELGALDGVVDADAWATIVPPGLTPQRPISATGVAALLACPYRFLLERILFLREPPRLPPTDAVAPIIYGQLFHTAAERFFATAGVAVCGREGALEDWLAVAADRLGGVVDEHFAEQPLRVAGAAETVRGRLQEQMEHLVRYEWGLPPRTFVASELSFGEPEPVTLDASGTTFYLRGAVDRLDRLAAGGLVLRDLKTGRIRPLEAEPLNPSRDLQLGTYALALEDGGAGGGDRVVVAAYVYPTSPESVERAFRGPHLDALRERTREWLGVAGALLRASAFPRTLNEAECAVCAFRPVCGEGAWARSAEQLARLPADHPMARFAQLGRRASAGDGASVARPAAATGPGWALRRFLLGLRALADRDDGVAEAALLRPPFFGVDLADAVTERAARGVVVPRARALRMDAVRAVVDDLRLRRHDQSPGAVARDLIESSGLGRAVAAGTDAVETLVLLYAAAAELDRLGLRDGLDFDAATEPVRAWIAAPDWMGAG